MIRATFIGFFLGVGLLLAATTIYVQLADVPTFEGASGVLVVNGVLFGAVVGAAAGFMCGAVRAMYNLESRKLD